MAAKAPTTTSNEHLFAERPIIIDLGKAKRKRIKALKRGRGKLMEEVTCALNEASDDIRSRLGEEAANGPLIPVVLIYRKKRKRRGKGIRLPLLFG